MLYCFTETRSCAPDQFACGDGSECIPSDWKCDGEYDCTNKADELSCGKSTSAHVTPFIYLFISSST